MRVALISLEYKIYPVSLLKIGAYLKTQNIECQLFQGYLPKENEFDEIWFTTLFTFDIPKIIPMIREAKKRCKKVKVGGISATLLPDIFKREGIEVYEGLWDEVEKCNPDYSLLEEKPDYSIAYLSRGCVRKCGFCMVPKLEPSFDKNNNWQDGILEGSKRILFYDNNWTATPIKQMEQDVEDIKEVVAEYGIREIDFNQGLDCRLLTDEKADLIAQLPIDPVRFAFDDMNGDGHWQKAIIKLIERGKTVFNSYCLFNFEDTPEDFYYRIREACKIQDKHGVSCKMFPMRYQPILEIGNRDYVGKKWKYKEMRAIMRIVSAHSVNGIIHCSGGKLKKPFDEFELYFGKDEKEFKKLLNYPDIGKLMKLKKAQRREFVYETR